MSIAISGAEGAGPFNETNLSAFGDQVVAGLRPDVQISFPYNVNDRLADKTVTGSGTVTHADSMAVASTTAAASSSAMVETRATSRYSPGEGVQARMTAIFTNGVAGSKQEVGIGTDDDGMFFQYNGATFGIVRRCGGSDTFVAQADWSHDKMDGNGPSGMTLDQTKGNVYQCKFQWLGFGPLSYYVEDDKTGRFVLVHRIDYTNRNTVPSMEDPHFKMRWYAENTTNDTDIAIKGSSAAIAVEGAQEPFGIPQASDNSKAGVGTTFTNILTIRNRATFAGKPNRTTIRIDGFTAAVDGTKPALIRLIHQGALGGVPSYTDINTDESIAEVDTGGTTVTGGYKWYSFAAAKVEGRSVPVKELRMELDPGETVTVAVAASSGTTDVSASINWTELF